MQMGLAKTQEFHDFIRQKIIVERFVVHMLTKETNFFFPNPTMFGI